MWGAQQGFNQWALQPAMFNDVPHEQIDWAALAKQWIQMQQTPPTSDATAPPAVMPPIASSQVVAQPVIAPPPPPGHGSMVSEEFHPEIPVNTPLLKTPIAPGAVPEHFQPERHFDADPASFVPKNLNNSYWNKPQWEGGASGDNDNRMWPAPPVEPSLIGGKETYDYGHMHDNPPLAMQSIDYNHMSDFSYGQVYGPPPETQYDQYWSQVNAAPPITPMFLKKERNSAPSSSHRTEEDSSQIDAAKRKQLPAWIREGLEKMEQERLKKIEKEKSEKEKAERLAMEKLKSESESKNVDPAFIKSKFDSDSEPEPYEEETKPTVQKRSPPFKKRSPSPIDVRTEEEKRQEYMLNVRRLLTEILLSVTNAEMYAVAEEVLKKEWLKARQLASTASLSTVATGLRGLASYGTESEASEAEEDEEDSDSEEELYRRIREKKKLFAIKSKKMLAEIERKELEEQNEALKAKNDTVKSTTSEKVESEVEIEELEKVPNENDEAVPVIDTTAKEPIPDDEPEIDGISDSMPNETKENNNQSKDTHLQDNDHQSQSSSNSSESENELSKRHKRKSSRDEDEKRASKKEKGKSPLKKHLQRSRSSDSDSSDKHHKSRSPEKYRRSSSSKKKKYKRSDSSSSSSSDTKRRYSSKSESSHNHHRDQRSHSYEDRERKHRRSLTPKRYRSSRDSHKSRDSHSHRDKYEKRDKYDRRRSPSPHRRSSKLPKKYRSSRTPSSERESRKSKKSRTH